MQHLDEGAIHSWLDGALSADEAARVEAHVKECPQCASAVAEARGFVAAASRILTSLDNVPSGIIPAAPSARARNWPVWRAAAAVLVVALGSFVVLRDRIAARDLPASARMKVLDTATRASATAASSAGAAKQTAADVPARNAAPLRGPLGSQTPVTARAPSTVNLERSQSEALKATPPTAAAEFGKTAQAPTNARRDVRDNVGAPSGGVVVGATASAPRALSSQTSGITAMNAAIETQPIRVVGHPRVIGQMQTLYEVAPGDTVLLAEVSNQTLESVVITGTSATAATTDAAVRAGTRLQPQAKAAAPADNQRKPEPTAPAATTLSAAPSVQTSNGITTLSWKDPATGTTMKLSGRHTLVELLDIKRRIEQVRAAEAAKKRP